MSTEPIIRIPKVKSTFGGTVVYPPGSRFGPRIQTDLQLVLLHTGSMTVYIDEVPHCVQPGQVILLTPGHNEQFTFAKEHETWHRWIAVHVDELSVHQRQQLEQLPATQSISEEMNRLTDILISLRLRYDAGSETLCSLGLAALQLFIAETTSNHMQLTHPSVLHAKKYIEGHFHDHLSLEGIANAVGLSPEHLVRLFRKHEGITPIKFVWNYRILRANELLTQTGLAIGEIAMRCGFKNSFHFARLFKTSTGTTPSDYRHGNWRGE
ncbi:AraC family transcriptional regulator [Paenibacillus qinlingensis]|uniref:AraC family transcriptional regulator of arabinose operon n=1 Tax=Paenibacillus qinlingensis TaxID=1837343 RepID=A0ABU1NUF4_9BACL|nr:AraC family transcriptional regulator [Paenibacillus qinlingensis]MDR6551099.1 AraC family transcriptional regulator of arabinose operon [Paenibacillus qinlingensis]